MSTTTTLLTPHHHHHSAPSLSPRSPSSITTEDPEGQATLPRSPRRSFSPPRPPPPSTEEFRAAITQMYSGRSAIELLPSIGLHGPISIEQLRSRASSSSSQATRIGPLRADHTLPTPRSATDREIEDINTRAAEEVQRSQARAPCRPLSAQQHPTYHIDLKDDTDPQDEGTRSPCDTSCDCGLTRPESVRRKRVYLIKRPHSVPVYGRITPVSDAEESLPPESSSHAREGRIPDPQSARASWKEGSQDFLEKIPHSSQGSRIPQVTVSEKHISNFDQRVHSSVSRTRDESQVGEDNCDPVLTGHVSPVQLVESEADSKIYREQSVQTKTPSHCQCPKVPVDWDSDTVKKIPCLQCEHFESTDSAGRYREKRSPNTVSDGVNSVNDSQDTECSPSHLATRLPVTSVDQSVTEGDCRSTSILQTHPRHSRTDSKRVRGKRTEEESTSISGVTNKDLLHPSSRHFLSDSSSLPPSEALNTQPTSHSTEFHPGDTVEDRSIRTQNAESIPILEETLNNTVCNLETFHTSRDSSSHVSKELDPRWQQTNLPSNTELSDSQESLQQIRAKILYLRTSSVPQSSTLPAGGSPRDSSSPQLSHINFGSVDNLLVGLDTETTFSKKKKKKKSAFKSWFTPKKGKYLPGKETVPFIESPAELSSPTLNFKGSECTSSQPSAKLKDKKSSLRKDRVDCSSLNTNNSNYQPQDSAESAAAAFRDRMERLLAKQPHGDTSSTDTPQGKLAAKTDDGKGLTTVTDNGSQSQISGDASDCQSLSSVDSKASAGSGKVFSLLSSKVLKGGESGAYENTTVKFNTNVTRHEVITIKGSSHTTMDKSIVLNESSFPDDLTSTFKTKPVMVRERKVSSGSSQEQPTLTTFSGPDSRSLSSLSLAELESHGVMKLSSRQGSENDIELLSTASRIVQTQGSDGTLDDPTDDDHELVVIREYIFAARKTSTEGGTSGGTTPREVTAAKSSDSIHTTNHGPSDGRENPASSLSALRENDSGVDSPPSLQECHLPPVKPKRSGRGSREISNDEIHTLKTLPPDNENMEKMSFPAVHAALPPGPDVTVMPGDLEESSSDSRLLTSAESFVDKLFTQQQSQPVESLNDSTDIGTSKKNKPHTDDKKPSPPTVLTRSGPGDPNSCQENSMDQDSRPDEFIVAAAEEMLETSPELEGNNVGPDSVGGKLQQGAKKELKEKSGIRVNLPYNESSSAGGGLQNVLSQTHDDLPRTDATNTLPKISERKVDGTSAPLLQSSVPTQPEKPVAKHEQDKDTGPTQPSDDKPEGFARWSCYRDSLSEEEYNKPWEIDFSSIEEDIRSKITQAFPSAQEEDENEQRESQTETDISGHVKASLESLSPSTGKQSAGKPESHKNKGLEDTNVSASMDNANKDSVEDSANHCKVSLQATENVPAKTEARAGAKQNTEAKTLPAAASTLSPASKPRKTSAQFERPLLPQPPPPPPAAKISKEETKPVHSEKPHPEKPHKTNAAEKESPLHHRKLKEKFKKVFSHSSEDKKQPKAEHKKTTPLMKKKDMASPKEDRASNNEQKKSEMSNISSKPDELKTKPVDGNERVQTADHLSGDEIEAPDHDYMLPNIPSAERGPEDESSDPQDHDSLLYTSINHEVKLPFSPKEARKILKAEKKNSAKTQAEEGKDSSLMDETKIGSPRSHNRALKWIRKKLATKGKKTPHSKKYTISGPDELEADEGDLSSREAKSPRASDTNSDSEDSHDSSDSCHSESEEEAEGKTKPPRKMPFWGGKKDKKTKKKKAAQTESDSDSSAEESKLKLFSWSLGRKKGHDSSDHEDNLPSGYKKTTEWTPSEESSGVSGTFRKISDDVPQKQSQAQANTAAAPGQQKDKGKEAGIKITVTDASTDSKETSDSILASEAGNLLKQAQTAPNTDTDTQRISDKDGISDPAHPKWFSFEECEEPEHKTYDDGEYAKLREDGAVKPNSDKLWKQSKSSGYVLARPMFLEDDSDDAASSKAERMTEAHFNLSNGKISESQTEKQHPGKDKSENSISEDMIVPSKAARPVHQAFSSLEKLSGQELRERIPDSEPPSSPVLKAKQKRVTFAKPSPQPKPQQPKKEAQGNPATEDEIVPSKADEDFWGLRVNRSSINKSESSARKDGSENSSVPKTGSGPEGMLDFDTHPDSTQLPDIEHQTSMDTDLTFNSHPAVSFTDSPRSNADSDDSAGRTYLDKPGFLEVAKASWGHQDGTSSKAAQSMPAPSEVDADPGKKLVMDTCPSGAGKTSETMAPGSVFGVTLKKRDVLKDTENGSSDSQVDSQDPKQKESSNTDSHDAHGLDKPDSSATIENLENKSSNVNKPDASPKHTVAVKGIENVANDDVSLMQSPNTSRRKTRAVTPFELKSARHQDAASATGQPKPVTKTPSLSDDGDNSPIDWLDSGKKSITTSKAYSPRPGKPSAIAPKPQISAKPKLVQDKGKVESPPAKLKQEIPSQDAKKILFPSEIPDVRHKAKDAISVTPGLQGTQKEDKDTSKPAVREKPIPPSKPIKPVKAISVSEVHKASKTLPDVKSPEPKPRKLLKDSKDNPGKADVSPQQEAKNIQQGINTKEVSTFLSTPTTDSYHQESSTDPSTSTWGEDSESTLDPNIGEFTLALDTRSGGSEKKPSAEKITQQGTNTEGVSTLLSMPVTDESSQESYTYPSTMSLGENSESPTNPCLGDFTLGLETHTGGSEKKRDPSGDKANSNPDDTNLSAIDGSTNLTQSGSEFTIVTDLVESQATSKFSPFSQSTPLTSNLATSAPTSDDITLSSISTIQRSEPPSDRTSEQHDSDIYEPIFFEDLHDPRSSRPTEAPPVRPEKVGKRRLDPPRIVAPEYDDDVDNMYDVPRTHQTFTFPTESSLPVLSIVDKRGSKTSLTSMKSLEPEDTIPPYATCHKSPQFVKLESDYGDDENPYMNDEDLHSLPSSRSPVVEKSGETHDAEEAVHASLKELFPEASSGKEETLPSGETRNVDEVDTVDSPSSDKLDSVKSNTRKFTVGSSSSESSSRSGSLSSDEGLAADTKVKKNETESKSDKNDTETHDSKADKAPEEEDQYLKSPEYQHSVEEINKLYAALEKEEQEMEKQSSSTEAQSPGDSAPTRTCRLLSFEEQRAELKPLKPKLADIPSEQTWDLEKQKAETPSSKKGSGDSKQTKESQAKPISTVRKHSSSSKKSPPPRKGGHKTNSPQTSPRLQKSASKSQDEPEGARAEIHTWNEKEGEAKETHGSKDSALHRLAGLFKAGIKGSPGTDRKVKATPEEHEQGSKGGDGEKERGQRTSGKEEEEDDSTNSEAEPQESSLVTEVFQHQMYAQVHKTPADGSKPPANTSQHGPEEEEASPPPVVGSPPTAKKTSTLSSFFVTKPKPHPGQKPDKMAAEAEKSETTQSDGSPKTGCVTKMATIGVKMPFAGVVLSKSPSKDLPQEDQEKEKDGNKKGNDESVPEQPVEVSVEITTSSERSVLKSSPEAAADSLEPGGPTSPSKTGPEPPKKPVAPKPLKKPGIWKPLQKPGEPEPATKPGTKPQPKPRDLTRTYSDVDMKLKVPPHPDPLPEVAPETPNNPEGDEAPEVPTRHSSLLTPDSLLDNISLSEPTKALPEIPPHIQKNRLRVPGAGAVNESEDSEEEETTEDEEDGGSDHLDGDNPPLPERRYRETQAKYNEYSNVIRVDSTKLKEARLRSLSRPVLTESDPPDKKDKVSKLRNALSLEGGLDKKGKKTEKKRKEKKTATGDEGGGEGGERKAGKKPFSLRSFKDLFGKRKKSKGGGGGEGEEEGVGEEEEAENVYEVVDDTATEPKSKSRFRRLLFFRGTSLTKHTWPKQNKRKKSESGDHPPTTHHPPLVAVDSSHASKDIRPIGRLLQLNPDGTQMVELIRPPNGQLGVQLTQGNQETLQGKFVSGFVDKSTQKLLSGILHIGDQILKINDITIDDCPLVEVHSIIDSQQRLKFLVYPGDNQ